MKTLRELGMENFKHTGIYALTAENLSRGRSNREIVDVMIHGGVRFLQYREKEKTAKAMYEECLVIREKTRAAGVTFIINDRVDLALAVGADGVHVGQDDLPPQAVRKLIGESMILGLSTHNMEQFYAAELSGVVDYVGVGPVFETQTKQDACAAVGLDYIRCAAAHGRLPFVAIGGIKQHNIDAVMKAGARTVAVISDIVGAQNVECKVRTLRGMIDMGIDT